jgi:Protein of unknown function (DUF2829)
MDFLAALDALKEGKKVKLPEWTGHWFMEVGNIKVLTGNCTVLDTPHLEDYKHRTDWEVTDGLRDFGGAVKALEAGKRVARKGWNGKGLFVFMQVPSEIDISIVPKMQSLPQAVKDEFVRRHLTVTTAEEEDAFKTITYQNQMAIVYPDNSIHGWAPSASDSLAEDWEVLI